MPALDEYTIALLREFPAVCRAPRRWRLVWGWQRSPKIPGGRALVGREVCGRDRVICGRWLGGREEGYSASAESVSGAAPGAGRVGGGYA